MADESVTETLGLGDLSDYPVEFKAFYYLFVSGFDVLSSHREGSLDLMSHSLWIVGQVEGTDCRLYWIRDPAVTGPVNWREPTGSGSRQISYPSNCWEPQVQGAGACLDR
jgi:hypothetical protein